MVPGYVTTSEPDHSFWRNVELRAAWPRRGLLDSALAHAALLGLLYAISIWPDSAVHLASPLSKSISIRAYTLSGYLPELHGPIPHPKAREKPDPVRAKQEILSLPEAPDNLRQTIVAPPAIKLRQELNLPNIIAYQPIPPVQPLAASERASLSARLPALTPGVAGPVADTGSLYSSSRLLHLEPQVIAPAPGIAEAAPRLALPLLTPNVAGPAPDVDHLNRDGARGFIANLAPSVSNPVPAIPQIACLSREPAQLIALSLYPAEVHAPIEVPEGNLRGAFADSPTARLKATGSPGNDAHSMVKSFNAPAGISVTNPAHNAMPDAPIAAPSPPRELAKASAPSIPMHERIAHESTGTRNEVEKRIFAGRRSYALSVNMPNLNASTGSWVIHFAERHPTSGQLPIVTPEVLNKFDPAYPPDLMRDGVQGIVILTAIIRADGSVGDIVIAKSLNPLLDRNAAEAFSHWLFRPAMRNGQAIDLEAVITIPFRAKPAGF